MTTDLILSTPQLFDPAFVEQVFGNIDISMASRRDYLYRIGRFQNFVSGVGVFDRNTLLEYKRSLAADTSISVTTKNKYLIVARVFCEQLFRVGALKVDVSQGVKAFRLNGGFKVNGFSDDEVRRIIDGMNQLSDLRLKAIISLKMFSGLRDIEVVRLTAENINLIDSVIHIHGKGRDGVEALPLVPQVVEILRAYQESTGIRSGFIFTSQSKRNKGGGLTTKSVWLAVRQFLDGLGIKRNPHQMRAFFATELVKKMDNLFDVITFTRHRNIQTLQSYVNQIGRERTIPQFKKVFQNHLLHV